MNDTGTRLSEVRLFIEQLRKDMPEIFSDNGGQAPAEPVKKLLYQGGLYDIRVSQNPDHPSDVALENGVVLIRVSDTKSVLPEVVLENWLRARAQEMIPAKVERWAKEMGITYSKVSVRNTRTLWGSCSHEGNLSFCWRVIKAPEPVIDYLVIHELAHIPHPDHSPEFWAAVALWCPDYKNSRKWLREYKNELFSQVEIEREAAAPTPESEAEPE